MKNFPSILTNPGPALRLAALLLLALALREVSAKDESNDPGGFATLEALSREGIEHYRAERYEEAIDAFRRAYRVDAAHPSVRSNLAWAWIGLGLDLLNAGEVTRARQAFTESLDVQEEPHAHFGLAYIHFLELEDDEARHHLEIVGRLQPDFARARKILALIEYRGGRSERALDLMKEAVALDEKDREARSILDRWTVEARVVRHFKTRLTRHFEVRHDPAIDSRLVRMVGSRLEEAYGALGEALGTWPRRRLVVSLFTEEGFQEATGSFHWVGGLFDGQVKLPVSATAAEEESGRRDLLRGLHHELAHALVVTLYPGCPNWLNEGLAQYFEQETMRVLGDAENPSPSPRRLRLAQLREAPDRRIRFGEIPGRLWEVSDESRARWTYLQGLAFVEYLVDEFHAFRLRLLLAAAREGGSLQRGFQQTYGATLDELEEDWWKTVLASGSSSAPDR